MSENGSFSVIEGEGDLTQKGGPTNVFLRLFLQYIDSCFGFKELFVLIKVPASSSSKALSNSSSVFITIGPLQATGSFNG